MSSDGSGSEEAGGTTGSADPGGSGPGSGNGTGTATYAVELLWADGRSETVDVGADETVLEATDESAIDLRYGCREGRCVSCTARLLRGDLDYIVEPEALSDRLREEGFVLLCVATPASDCLIEVGRNVLSDAFPGLWRTETGVAYVEELRDAGKELRRLDGTAGDDPGEVANAGVGTGGTDEADGGNRVDGSDDADGGDDTDETDDTDGTDPPDGPFDLFDNLQAVREAYRRARDESGERRIY